jgi:hypothetical protein
MARVPARRRLSHRLSILLVFASCPVSPSADCSGSMEPGFQRGDILFLENNSEDLTIGDVVVFKIKGRDIPIVHRVLSKFKRCVHSPLPHRLRCAVCWDTQLPSPVAMPNPRSLTAL